MPHSHSRNRLRVCVRSCVDSHILRRVSEREAREMCDEDSRGERLYNRQPEAYRMSRKKAPLTDIQLLTPLRSEKSGGVMLTASDSRNNGFAKAFRVLGGPEISIHALDRSEAKVASWPEIHDDRAVTICAGKVYGATLVSVGQ